MKRILTPLLISSLLLGSERSPRTLPYGLYTNGYISVGVTGATVRRFSFFHDWATQPRLDVNQLTTIVAPNLKKSPMGVSYGYASGAGDAVGFVSPQKVGGNINAGTDDWNYPNYGDTAVIQVLLIERIHDGITVIVPRNFQIGSQVTFELSISHMGSDAAGNIWMMAINTTAFAGINLAVIPTEGGDPMADGAPLEYAYYKGNASMASGVGFEPGMIGRINSSKRFFYTVNSYVTGFDLNIMLQVCCLAYFTDPKNPYQNSSVYMERPFNIYLKAITPGVIFTSNIGSNYSDSSLYDPPYSMPVEH